MVAVSFDPGLKYNGEILFRKLIEIL